MKQELAIIRASREALPPGVDAIKPSVSASRREVREATDFVMREALESNDLATLAAAAARLMLTTATVVDRHGIEPDVTDLIEAMRALVEDSRAVLDRGLMIDAHATARCGAVMVELAVRGLCAALNFPYGDLLAAVHAGENVAAVLVKSGHISAEKCPDSA